MSKMTLEDTLWTQDDLERRWKAKGATPEARRKWVQRRVKKWGIPREDTRYEPRFLPAEVLRIEARELAREMGRRRR